MDIGEASRNPPEFQRMKWSASAQPHERIKHAWRELGPNRYLVDRSALPGLPCLPPPGERGCIGCIQDFGEPLIQRPRLGLSSSGTPPETPPGTPLCRSRPGKGVAAMAGTDRQVEHQPRNACLPSLKNPESARFSMMDTFCSKTE